MKIEPTSLLGRVFAAIDRFWYAPAPAARLRTLRVIIGTYAVLLLVIGFSNLTSVTEFHATEFAPVGPVRLLSAPLPTAVVYALAVLAVVFGGIFVSGFQYRYLAPIFAFLLLWVTSYRNSWGMKFHTENLLVWHVLLLAFAPAAERPPPERAVDGRYGWAIRAMCAVTVVTYFLAGLAKIRLSGHEWMTGEALRIQVAYDTLRKIQLGSVHSPFGAGLIGFTFLFRLFGALTLGVELGAPLALLGKRAARIWVISSYAFHLGVGLLMAIAFPYPLSGAAYASFFEVERLGDGAFGAWLQKRFGRRVWEVTR